MNDDTTKFFADRTDAQNTARNATRSLRFLTDRCTSPGGREIAALWLARELWTN